MLRDAATDEEFEITHTQLKRSSDAKGADRYFYGVCSFLANRALPPVGSASHAKTASCKVRLSVCAPAPSFNRGHPGVDIDRGIVAHCHSSSASRFTAGAAGFLIFNQCANNPGRFQCGRGFI